MKQEELVAEDIVEMYDRVGRAESILGRLASGFWVCVLDQNSMGEEPMGGRVLDYWRKYNAEEPLKGAQSRESDKDEIREEGSL